MAVTTSVKVNDVEDMAACASPSPVLKRQRTKQEWPVARACRWIVDHQIGISLTFVLGLFALRIGLVNSALTQRTTDKFLSLQFFGAKSGKYGIGWEDSYFVVFWLMVFTGVRVAFMEYLAAPFAQSANIKGRKEQVRFAEQAWIFVCYIISWTAGMYIWCTSDYWLNFGNMWTNWPDRELNGLVKSYYLIQIGFWLQQIMVVNIEERRKDHWQMCTHHIVTLSLLFASYTYHYTRVGNVILCLMDPVDYVLAFAKMLRYVGLQSACDCAFGVFVISWFVTRHVLYPLVCWSVYTQVPQMVTYGCYYGTNDNLTGPIDPPPGLGYLLEPFKHPGGMVCSTAAMLNSFLGLLLLLQAILLVWFGEIVKMTIRVLTGGNADDPRSDDEEEQEEAVEDVAVSTFPPQAATKGNTLVSEGMLEEEVGVEQMHFRSKPITRSKSGGRTSGVQLPVKKELLNRVGCDTKTTN